MKNPMLMIMLAGAVLLAGCHEYRVEVALDESGAGSRQVTLDTEHRLGSDTRWLLGLEGGSWQESSVKSTDGYRYRRTWDVRSLDQWTSAGGTVMRAAAEGSVNLMSSIQVEKIQGPDGWRQVYRETLSWQGLAESVADVMGRGYGDLLRREFPSLPDSVVFEARGVMVACIALNWTELIEAEGEQGGEADLEGRFFELTAHRMHEAGVDAGLIQRVLNRTADWEIYDRIPEVLPGLEECAQSSFELQVTMPGAVTGGNADEVEGRTAIFKVDLAQTMGEPVVLEVESRL